MFFYNIFIKDMLMGWILIDFALVNTFANCDVYRFFEIVAFLGVDRDLPKSAERFDFIARSQRDDATVQLRIILGESSITDVMSYLAKERV